MRKYIFLTFAVRGIGGTQIYVRNKLRYLQKAGWTVSIISTENEGADEIYVKELKPFGDAILPELLTNPYLYTPLRRRSILKKLESLIGQYSSDSVIETNFFQVTLWGELLAEKMGVRHFIFLIQEDYRNLGQEYLRYYSYKYDRGELAGNTHHALAQLFEGYRELADGKIGCLSAFCSNVIEECESEFDEKISNADFHIGSIGRINKPFVIQMVRDVTQFALQHSDKTFQLIFFGGDPDQKLYQPLYDAARPAENLEVLITGPLYPIPLHLLSKMDVFISSAGAAATSQTAGFLTIAIDAIDLKPIGLLGITTQETIHRIPGEKCISTGEWLEKILIQKQYPIRLHAPKCSEACPDSVFDAHIRYVAQASPRLEYYNISRIRPGFLIRLGCQVLGKNRFLSLYQLLKGCK